MTPNTTISEVYNFSGRAETTKILSNTGFASLVADTFLFLILVWYLLPEVYLDTVPLIGGSKVVTWLLAIFYSSLVIELMVARKRLTGWLIKGCLAFAYMVFMAFMNLAPAFQLKVFGNDCLCFLALIAALLWAPNRSESQILKACRIGALLSTCALVVTLAGLLNGFIAPGLNSTASRLYTQSLWGCIFASACLLPFVAVTTKFDSYATRTRLSFWAFGIATLFAAAAISATRSAVIQTITCLLVSMFSVLRNRKAKVLAGGFLVVCASAAVFVAGSRLTILRGRAESTVATQEERYVEATRLFEQLDDRALIGWGMGSLFESPVVIDDYGMAAAPHIGCLTFLQKGGGGIFILFILAPLWICIRRITRIQPNRIAYAAAGSMAVYFSTAFLSGGWTPLNLFIYGIGLSEASYFAAGSTRKGRRFFNAD